MFLVLHFLYSDKRLPVFALNQSIERGGVWLIHECTVASSCIFDEKLFQYLWPENIFQNLNRIPYMCTPSVWFDLRAPSISIRKHRFWALSDFSLHAQTYCINFLSARAKWNIQSARKHALIPSDWRCPPISKICICARVKISILHSVGHFVM